MLKDYENNEDFTQLSHDILDAQIMARETIHKAIKNTNLRIADLIIQG